MKATSSAIATAFLLIGCGGVDDPTNPADEVGSTQEAVLGGPRVHYTRDGRAGTGALPQARGTGINYHGGPLLLGTPNVYFIWYGSWPQRSTGNSVDVVTNFMEHEGGSPYYNINTTYYNGSNVHITNAIHYSAAVYDTGSLGTALSDANIQTIVGNHLSQFNGGVTDTNAVYFVLTSSGVNETSGFCTQYCGWHTNGTIGGKDVKYAFVGNPDRCPSSCEIQTTGPNTGTANTTGGADGMVSIVAHEFEEAASDPDLNAWWQTSTGEENADKCAWTFGSESTAANGSKYNMTIGGRNYLVQQNWVNLAGVGCAKSH